MVAGMSDLEGETTAGFLDFNNRLYLFIHLFVYLFIYLIVYFLYNEGRSIFRFFIKLRLILQYTTVSNIPILAKQIPYE